MQGMLKWLQSVAVGAIGALYTWLQAQSPSGEGLEAILTGLGLTLLVKALGWVIGKISPKPAPVP